MQLPPSNIETPNGLHCDDSSVLFGDHQSRNTKIPSWDFHEGMTFYSGISRPFRRYAAWMVCLPRMAVVTVPTPPGTGVIMDAWDSAAS